MSEPATDGANTAITEALWRKVLDNFDDDTVHAKFIQHCNSIGDLPDAAKRYRDHRDALGDADEVSLETVDKRLNAVTLLAVAQLDVQRGTQPRRHPLVWVLTVTVALMLGAAIIGLLRAVML